MTNFQRAFFRGKIAFIAVFLGVGTGLMLVDLAKLHVSPYIAVLVSVALWYWVMGRDLGKNIEDSRLRMRDAAYVSLLEEMGVTDRRNDSSKR